MKKQFLEDLKARGIFNNITNEEKFLAIENNDLIYAGFDPTAISLHLGNYIQISILLRMKKFGIKPLALVGGATGMIGDPSFKQGERSLLDFDMVEKNKTHIRKQLQSFGLEVFDNYDIYKEMNILEFLRVVGKNINVAYMLSKDSVSSRIESGLSFTEFSYQLIQAWDFKFLYENKNVRGQLGGSDQWGNITSGVEVIKKVIGEENSKAFALTSNLLTDANGNKFGKSTGGGSLWLDKTLTPPFQMYQFLLNQPDSEVEKLLKWLTFLDLSEIESLMKLQSENKGARLAQKKLAFEIIRDIHGEDEANNAIKISNILFGQESVASLNLKDIEDIKFSLPTFEVDKNKNISEILIETKIVNSKRELREFIANQALEMNGNKILNENENLDLSLFENKYAIIKKGKRNYFILKGI